MIVARFPGFRQAPSRLAVLAKAALAETLAKIKLWMPPEISGIEAQPSQRCPE